jgi:acetyltransferase-like isoleucine patch superfamily enzyme
MINIILACLPSFLHIRVRRLLGQKIGKGTKIHFGSLILSKKINIGQNSSIGPFCFIKAQELEIGNKSKVKALSIISTRIVQLADYTHIAPLAIIQSPFNLNSKLSLGKHSRIFPFCWLDTGEGISIGSNTSIGGHTTIFTHGSWSNYIDGGSTTFGPVNIADNVWIPWRVFILPNVSIGSNCMIAANSTVEKSMPEGSYLARPASKLYLNLNMSIDKEESLERANLVIKRFAEFLEFKKNISCEINDGVFDFKEFKIIHNDISKCKENDLLFITNGNCTDEIISELTGRKISVIDHENKVFYKASMNKFFDEFVFFVRRFGIRLEENNLCH